MIYSTHLLWRKSEQVGSHINRLTIPIFPCEAFQLQFAQFHILKYPQKIIIALQFSLTNTAFNNKQLDEYWYNIIVPIFNIAYNIL